MYTNSLSDGGLIPPQVAVGGRLAGILYFGAAPGYPGYNQVNFRVPPDATKGVATIQVSAAWIAGTVVSIAVQ